MMAARRSKKELNYEVLKFCAEKPRPISYIIGELHLNWSMTKGILAELLDRKLISKGRRKGRERYLTTQKGKDVMVLQSKIEEQMK
jgi:predicted transcriptional regulator